MPGAEPRFSYLVGRLDRALRRRLEEAVRPHGLTVRQYTTLTVLRARSGLSNAQLARRSLMTPQSMNEVLTALATLGFVRREPDETHGRVIRTALTTAGADALAACDRAVDRLENEMLADLTAQDRERLLDGLKSCVRALRAGSHDEP
jgi:DNA-binding MarR family transcriptional regulator